MNTRYFVSALIFLGLGMSNGVKAYEQIGFDAAPNMSPQVAAAVERLTAEKILEGYPDNELRPNQPMKRNEMVVGIARFWKLYSAEYGNTKKSTTTSLLAVFSPPEYYGSDFDSDIFRHRTDTNTWWYRAEELITENQLIAQYPDGYFRAKRPASRAELATLLARLAERRAFRLAAHCSRKPHCKRHMMNSKSE